MSCVASGLMVAATDKHITADAVEVDYALLHTTCTYCMVSITNILENINHIIKPQHCSSLSCKDWPDICYQYHSARGHFIAIMIIFDSWAAYISIKLTAWYHEEMCKWQIYWSYIMNMSNIADTNLWKIGCTIICNFFLSTPHFLINQGPISI